VPRLHRPKPGAPSVPGRVSTPRKDQAFPRVHLIVESTRALTLSSKRLAVLAVALLALGGGLSGCGETGAEEDAGGHNAAQEERREQRQEENAAGNNAAQEEQGEQPPEEAGKESQSESSGESSGEQDEVGSSSHASDSSFCSEHHCVGSFTTEGGTIVACSDGTYTHAGGLSGACSHHGGERE
jgi:hypothetical protein